MASDLGLKGKLELYTHRWAGLLGRWSERREWKTEDLGQGATVGRVWEDPGTPKKCPSNLFKMHILGSLPSNFESIVGGRIYIFIKDPQVILKFPTQLHTHFEKQW